MSTWLSSRRAPDRSDVAGTFHARRATRLPWWLTRAPMTRRDSEWHRPHPGVAALVAALAIALGMTRIGSKSLWFDETVSADFASRSFSALLPEIAGGDPNMSLYYVLLNLWRRLFGDSELALRSLSALAGAGAVVAIYALGTRLFSRRIGTFAAALLAVNEFMLQYAQTARGYTLLACLATMSCHLFVVELERPSVSARVAYVVVSAAAVYVHYFAALVLIAQLCTLLLLRRRYPLTLVRAAMAAAVIALCVPAIVFARAGGTSRIDWIPPLTLLSVPSVIVKMAGRSDALTVVFSVAVVWALQRVVREWRRERERPRDWSLLFVLLWLLVPFAIAVAVSFRRPLLQAQYLIVCLPALCLVTAAALSAIEPPKHGTWLVLLCCAVSLVRVVALYRGESIEDWRSAVRYVASEAQPHDQVAFFPPFSKAAFAYYANRSGVAMPRIAYVSAASPRRVWLVIRDFDQRGLEQRFSRLRAELGATRAESERARFNKIRIVLFERADSSLVAR